MFEKMSNAEVSMRRGLVNKWVCPDCGSSLKSVPARTMHPGYPERYGARKCTGSNCSFLSFVGDVLSEVSGEVSFVCSDETVIGGDIKKAYYDSLPNEERDFLNRKIEQAGKEGTIPEILRRFSKRSVEIKGVRYPRYSRHVLSGILDIVYSVSIERYQGGLVDDDFIRINVLRVIDEYKFVDAFSMDSLFEIGKIVDGFWNEKEDACLSAVSSK